jgi:hypothetical protein
MGVRNGKASRLSLENTRWDGRWRPAEALFCLVQYLHFQGEIDHAAACKAAG